MRTAGFWSEDAEDLPGLPRVRDAPLQWPNEEEPLIVGYLTGGVTVGYLVGDGPDWLDPSNGVRVRVDEVTDGEWLWRSNLAYYVERYHVALPSEFVEHMRSNGWAPPNDPDRIDAAMPDIVAFIRSLGATFVDPNHMPPPPHSGLLSRRARRRLKQQQRRPDGEPGGTG